MGHPTALSRWIRVQSAGSHTKGPASREGKKLRMRTAPQRCHKLGRESKKLRTQTFLAGEARHQKQRPPAALLLAPTTGLSKVPCGFEPRPPDLSGQEKDLTRSPRPDFCVPCLCSTNAEEPYRVYMKPPGRFLHTAHVLASGG